MRRPRLERVVEGALAAGLLASGGLLVLGLALGTEGPLRWGIVLLMLTPVARVAILTAGLLKARDLVFGAVSLFVLAVLLGGIAMSVRLAPGGEASRAPAPSRALPR